MKKRLKLLLVAILLLLSISMVSGSIKDYAISCWDFENDLLDSFQNNDFTATGDTSYISGKRGLALSFDGVDDFMFTSGNGKSNFSITSANYTLCYWLKTSTTGREGLFTMGSNDPNTDNTGGFISEFRNDYVGQIRYIFDTNSNNPIYNTTNHTYNSNTWVFHCMVLDGLTVNYYQNGLNLQTATLGAAPVAPTYALAFGGLRNDNTSMVAGDYDYNGSIDTVIIYNTAKNASEINRLYNYNVGYNCSEILVGGGVTNYFDVEAIDVFNDSKILNFSVVINGSTYSTINGTVNTGLNQSLGLFNISFFSNDNGGYYNLTFLNYDVVTDLTINASKLFRLYNSTFSGYKVYNNMNYTNNLIYTINYTCPSFYSAQIIFLFNNTLNRSITLTCNNQSVTSSYNYIPTIEGNFTGTLILNTSYLSSFNNVSGASIFVAADLYAPTIDFINFTVTNGFFNDNSNISLRCVDNIAPILEYNLTWNGDAMIFENVTVNTTKSNISVLIDGNNTLIGTCKDFFYNTSETLKYNVYVKRFVLINEQTGAVFTPSNLSSTRVYFDDNSSYYDFKLNNSAYVNFTGTSTNRLRFEFIDDGLAGNDEIINRYIDLNVVDTDLRICANLNDVIHYEQLVYSAAEKIVVVKSVFADCLVAADYTRFAYQDTFLLKFFTIDRNYYLYTEDEGNRVFLSSIDGSIASTINLDVLEFNKDSFNINLLQSALSFKKTGTNEVTIYYRNLDSTTSALQIEIVNMDDNSVVFSSTDFNNFSNVQINFDYSTLSVNETTLFKITVTKTNPSGATTIKKYFNINGSGGGITAGFALAFSLLLVIFGFTFASVRVVFSWFGLFLIIAAMGLLAFAVQEWYIIFLEGIYGIMLIYVGIITFKQNQSTLT